MWICKNIDISPSGRALLLLDREGGVNQRRLSHRTSTVDQVARQFKLSRILWQKVVALGLELFKDKMCDILH